jgi:hypothetical protein
VAGIVTQSTTLASVPSGGAYAFDKIGTAATPATNDLLAWGKLDVGAAGSSAPVSKDGIYGVPVVQLPAQGITHKGRANTFRIPGRAGTAGQKLLSIHNATGSTVKVDIEQVTVDCVQLAVIAVTVQPPIIRVYKVTVLPTNGTAVTKVSRDSGLGASSGSVTILGDASADGTGSGTALTATIPGGAVLTQEFAPRLITAVGYEMFDRTVFFADSMVTLNALEGIVVMLDYTLATQNPTSTHWLVGAEWNERA